MKIILATPIYPPEIGGPATYTKELCERIAKKHEITVVTYTDLKTPFPGTKLLSVSKRRPLPTRLLKFFLTLLREATRADLIYVQNAMAAGLPVALAAILTGRPFVLKFVGDEAWERATQNRLTEKRLEEFLDQPAGGLKIRLMMMIQGFVLRRAKIVTTPSEYLSQEIIKSYKVKPERAIVNYNASEDHDTLPFEAKIKTHQVATTARLVAWKGVAGIIRAINLLKKKFPNIKLVIAGDGPEMTSLQKLSQELGLAEKIIFLGKVSRAETWQLRKESEVYVLNSTYEGLPHTVLTSFAAEIPTVATNISGTNEAIYHEKTGLLVEPGDDRALAHAIERYFTDEALKAKVVRNGTELLKSKFSWGAHIATLNKIFELSQKK